MTYKKGLYILFRHAYTAPMPPALFDSGADLRHWATVHKATVYPLTGIADYKRLIFDGRSITLTPMPDWPLVTVYTDEPEATYKLTSRTFSQDEKDALNLPNDLWEQVS